MSNTFKSEIAPKGMKFDVNEFMISDKYATILTIISYPKIIGPGFLANVTNLPGVKVVIKHIPIDFSTMSRMINKEIADLKERYQHENERTLQERIRQDYESLESFVQMLAATQSKIFDFQMHIMLTADTKEELENSERDEIPKNIFAQVLYQYENNEIYSTVINSVVMFIKNNISIDDIEYISGGERRDWYFSNIIAYLLKKPF